MPLPETLPVLVNKDAGSAAAIMEQLAGKTRIRLRLLPAGEMAAAVDNEIASGHKRIAVSGGDGTIGLAAARASMEGVELAVLPGGTLNHFAGRLGIPTQVDQALELALHGASQPVDVGYVNERLFLNTSSVGAYVTFVRSRDVLERNMNYLVASMVAGIRRLLRLRSARVMLDGKELYTPLVFIGVGERELKFPALGQHKQAGRPGLHVIAVRSTGRFETMRLSVNALLRGVDPLARARQVENRILDELELGFRGRRRQVQVAVDGELVHLTSPLRYRHQPGKLAVVLPDAVR